MTEPAPASPFYHPPLLAEYPTSGFHQEEATPHPPEYSSFKRQRIAEDISPHGLMPPANLNSGSHMPTPHPPLQRGIFFKTRICAKFKLGTCPYGINCNFAHGPEDVRQPPPNWQEIVGANDNPRGANDNTRGKMNWTENHRIFRSRICRKFYNGEECPYGDSCSYLHEDPDKVREMSAITISTETTATRGNRGGPDHFESNILVGSRWDSYGHNQKPASWKKRPCHKWEMTGHCPFGERCQYAHGQEELQKFGGYTDAKNGNSSEGPLSKHLSHPIPTNDEAMPSQMAALQQQTQVKERLLNWKGPKKISRIYGDWIEDIPPSKES